MLTFCDAQQGIEGRLHDSGALRAIAVLWRQSAHNPQLPAQEGGARSVGLRRCEPSGHPRATALTELDRQGRGH